MVWHVAHDSPPLPEFTSWPTFPFEGELRVRPLDPPVPEEPMRNGEDPDTCDACLTPDVDYLWVSDRWRVRSLGRPTGLPMVLILESRSHLDLGDLPNLLAAELGVMTVRLERAIRSLDGVARVHVNRWGDGAAHLHIWFLARPWGRLQLRGTFLSLWDDILPPVPESQWRQNLAHIGAWLAEFGGRSYAETPRFDWQTPLTLSSVLAHETAGQVESSEPVDREGASDSDLPPSRKEDIEASGSGESSKNATASHATQAESPAVDDTATNSAATGTDMAARPSDRMSPQRLAPDSGDPDELWFDGSGTAWA